MIISQCDNYFQYFLSNKFVIKLHYINIFYTPRLRLLQNGVKRRRNSSKQLDEKLFPCKRGKAIEILYITVYNYWDTILPPALPLAQT